MDRSADLLREQIKRFNVLAGNQAGDWFQVRCRFVTEFFEFLKRVSQLIDGFVAGLHEQVRNVRTREQIREPSGRPFSGCLDKNVSELAELAEQSGNCRGRRLVITDPQSKFVESCLGLLHG